MAANLAFCKFAGDEISALSDALAVVFEFKVAELPAQCANWQQNFSSGQPVGDITLTYKSCDFNFQQFVESSEVVGVDLPITLG